MDKTLLDYMAYNGVNVFTTADGVDIVRIDPDKRLFKER